MHHNERWQTVESELVRRTPRYSLVIDIEMTHEQSGIKIRARTKMLSLFGCGVDTVKVLPQGTTVWIKLSQRGMEAKALARVVYSSATLGMGVVFTNIEQEDERILQSWISEYLSIPIQRQ